MFLQIKNISKSFSTGAQKVTALKNISLEVHEQEFVALVGPSGSGKTTLLNLIGCLDHADRGAYTFDGCDMARASLSELAKTRLHKIGFIFQDYNLIPTLNVLENVEFALWLQGVNEKERRQRSKHVLERVGLGAYLSRRPHALSRGQQQRVAVSRALVHRPKVVLGDELTANLDHKTGHELMAFLRDLNKQDGMTFIFATHDPVMMNYAKRLVRLHDGEMTSDEKK